MLFELVRKGEAKVPQRGLKWQMAGKACCREAFRVMVGIGKQRFRSLEEAAELGNLKPYEDQRMDNGGNAHGNQKYADADSFFCYCYNFMAQTFADTDDNCQEVENHWVGNKIHEWVQGRDGNILATSALGMHGLIW